MLNEQLKSQIDQEADKQAALRQGRTPAYRFGFKDGYYDGAEKYVEKAQAAERWKKEASLLLNPLLEWGQAQKDMPLGVGITAEILRRAKLWKAAEAKADRYEKALKEVQAKANRGIFPHQPVETMGAQMCIEIDQYITGLLTPKISDDERRL